MSLLDQARNSVNSYNDDTIRWMPEKEGEGLEGFVNAAGQFTYDGKEIPTVTLLTDDGKRYNIAGFRKVLRDELEAKKPQVGDRMAVVFGGQRKNKNTTGSHYVYRVALERRNKAPVDSGQDSKAAAPVQPATAAPSNLDTPPF